MPKYIDADALYAKVEELLDRPGSAGSEKVACLMMLGMISYAPAADVIPARYGEWVHSEGGVAHCSECGCTVCENEISPYCPHCGARMDGDA